LSTPGVNYSNIPEYCSEERALLYLLPQYERRKDFFPGIAKKIFPGATVVKFHFTHSKFKKSTSFAKNVMGKCLILKSKGTLVLPGPPPTPINMGHYLWGLEKVQRFVKVLCIASSTI